MDAVPGYTNKTWFQIPPDAIPEGQKQVVYTGQCAELCGRNHANMYARVIGMRMADYKRWYADKVQAVKAARTDVAKQHKALRPSRPRPVTAAPDEDRLGSHDRTHQHRPAGAPAPADHRPRAPSARPTRLDLVGHHDRSQEDRDHVPGHGAGVLRAGRRRGAADAHRSWRCRTTRCSTPERYNQILTMHGTTMVFLVVVPVWAGFANYLLPLMIGARDVAFPRLNALVVLDVPVRRPRAVRVDALLAARGRLVLLRAAVAQAVLGHQRPGGVDLHGPPHRPELDHRRDQLHRHDPQHARARHGLGPHAAVRVDDPDLRVPDHRRR